MPGLVPVMLALQPPQLLLQAALPMPVLHQAFSLCQQGHLLRLHASPLGLQLLVPGMHRDREGCRDLGPGQAGGRTLWGPPSPKHWPPNKAKEQNAGGVPTTAHEERALGELSPEPSHT